MKKIKNISVITSTYLDKKTGKDKKRYLTIGNIFEDGEYLKVKIDVVPLIKGGWDGWANCYDLEEETDTGAKDDDDRIPF